jgi:hypothetical protein
VDAQGLASKRFQLNMARVNRLVSLGQRLKQTPSDRSDELADLYRSAIVFLHASFEDMLRTTLEIRLGHAPKRSFDKVDVVVKACESWASIRYRSDHYSPKCRPSWPVGTASYMRPTCRQPTL